MALRFLLQGAAAGERNLYITLSETKSELLNGAASHGWTLDSNIEVFELQPAENMLDADQQQSLLYSSELELGETVKLIFDAVERIKPDRIVLDSLSEIRLLAQSSLRYRRQLLALKHYFARCDATVLALDDLTTDVLDKTAHSIAHGVIRLEELTPTYGAERRRMRVTKYRGQAFRGGYHDFVIKTGGVEIFPRLVSKEHLSTLPLSSFPAAISSWTRFSVAALTVARAPSFSVRPAPANPCSAFNSRQLPSAVARRRLCSLSMRNSASCSGAPRGWALIWKGFATRAA